MTDRVPGEDVAEACADALLAACAQVLLLRQAGQFLDSGQFPDDLEQVSIYDARDLAANMLDRVIVRTIAEGARPD